MADSKIAFHQAGIAKVLSDFRLYVPRNQRSYAWEDEHIEDLFQDIGGAIGQREYFLGTIVLTHGINGLEVADGQQRLATVTVLLAAIRDYFNEVGETTKATSIEQQYLRKTDLATDSVLPNLTLNTVDNEFFQDRILCSPRGGSRGRFEAVRPSHRKLERAYQLAREHIAAVVKPLDRKEGVRRLVEWVKYLVDQASVVMVTVPQHLNAFRLFETLNDRGLTLSQADLLKNYLLDLAGDRSEEAFRSWSAMEGALETIEEGLVVPYIRYLFISIHGPTREKELYDRITDTIATKENAIDFCGLIEKHASDFCAVLNPSHIKWNEYGSSTRQHINTIHRYLRVEQVRPLLLAIAREFSVREARIAFRMLVCWSVRFLLVGGRGGVLDQSYSRRAHEIGTGVIKTAERLYLAMQDIVPTDAQFIAQFETQRVSRSTLARYLLRALEQGNASQANPELIPNDDESAVNLEHILPVRPGSDWNMDEDEAKALHRRLGNIVLLRADTNSRLGNRPFHEKSEALRASAFALTRMAGEVDEWDQEAIEERQTGLAKIAVKTWPTRP